MAEEIEAKLEVEIDPMSDKKTKTETKTKTAKADDKVDKKVNESFVDTDKQEDTIPNVEPYTSKDAKRASDQKVEKRRKAVSKEKKEDDDKFIGRSKYDAPEVDGYVEVYIENDKKINIGDIVKVNITHNTEYDLIGNLV